MHFQHVEEEEDDNAEDGWCGTPVYDPSQTNALKSFNDIFQKQISEGDQFSPSKESFSSELCSPLKGTTKQSRLLSSNEGLKGIINTEQSTRVKWFSRVAAGNDHREFREGLKEKQQEGISPLTTVTATATTASWHWRNYLKQPMQNRFSISIPPTAETQGQQQFVVQEHGYQPQTSWLQKQHNSQQEEYNFSQKPNPIRRSEEVTKDKEMLKFAADPLITRKPRYIRTVSQDKRIKSVSLCDALPAISIIFDTLSTIMQQEKYNKESSNQNNREIQSKTSCEPQTSSYSSVSSSFQTLSTQKYPEKLPPSKIISPSDAFPGKQQNLNGLPLQAVTNLTTPDPTAASQSFSIPPSNDNPQPQRRHHLLKKSWLQRLEISPTIPSSIYAGEQQGNSSYIGSTMNTAETPSKSQLQPQKTVESGVFLRFKATKQPNIEFQAKLRKRQQRHLALKKSNNNTLNHTQTPTITNFSTPTVSTTGIALRLPDQKGQFTTNNNTRNPHSNSNAQYNLLSINSTQISSSVRPFSRLSYSPSQQQNAISNSNNNNIPSISKNSSLSIQPTSPSSSLVYQFIKPQKNMQQHQRNSNEQLNGLLSIQKKQESLLNTRTLTQNSVDRYSPCYKNKDEKKRILYTFSN